jgi:antitoxin HicB
VKRDYQMRVYQYPNGDTFDWVVDYPDLPGCVGAGDTVEEAIAEAKISKELWLEAAAKIGMAIPEPSTSFADEKYAIKQEYRNTGLENNRK